jgi:drug/metabolite transporter (DMT)-like permease
VIRIRGMSIIQSGQFRASILGAFAAVYILWGSTYLAIALAVQSIPPFLMIGVRSIAAGAILFGLAQFRSPGLPPARAWASAAASGILLFGGCHGTLAYAEKYVPSGLAAVMLATIPFWIVLIRFVISAEDRPKISTLVALVAGVAGVALFMLPTGPRGRARSPGNGADPSGIGLHVGGGFDHFRNGRAPPYQQ